MKTTFRQVADINFWSFILKTNTYQILFPSQISYQKGIANFSRILQTEWCYGAWIKNLIMVNLQLMSPNQICPFSTRNDVFLSNSSFPILAMSRCYSSIYILCCMSTVYIPRNLALNITTMINMIILIILLLDSMASDWGDVIMASKQWLL